MDTEECIKAIRDAWYHIYEKNVPIGSTKIEGLLKRLSAVPTEVDPLY